MIIKKIFYEPHVYESEYGRSLYYDIFLKQTEKELMQKRLNISIYN